MRFPKEHGLIMIWTSTVLLGLFQGLSHLRDPLGLLIGINFGLSIFLSYSTMNALVQLKFEDVDIPTVLYLGVSSILAFLWTINLSSLVLFSILSIAVAIWAVHSHFIGGRTSYTRSVLGTVAVSIQYPIIMNLSTDLNLTTMLGMWWLYFGVSLVLILAVGNYREKIHRYTTLVVWVSFLIITSLLYIIGILHPITLVFLIDPTLRSLYHGIVNPTLQKNRINIRKVGWNLSLSTFLFLILSIILGLREKIVLVDLF